VCWDGRRTAARAIADAMPFLHRAETVEMVTVDDGRTAAGVAAGIDMASHLRRHGLTVTEKKIVPGNVDVANTLLSHAADSGADFVVMGGYGRSRLREFLLGGATSGILRAMTVPTFMSH
jgi:nucleotide-binding universal stress UspA family protein